MIVALLITQFIGVPVRVPVRPRGRADRREGCGDRRPRGLCGDHRARLLHEQRHAVHGAGPPRRHGAGRDAGPEPIAVRQHDPAPQVVGVLRVLRRVRTLRRHPRPGAVRVGRGTQRDEPQRHPLGARLLRDRRVRFCSSSTSTRDGARPARPRRAPRPRRSEWLPANSHRPLARANDLRRFSIASTRSAASAGAGHCCCFPITRMRCSIRRSSGRPPAATSGSWRSPRCSTACSRRF